MNRRWFLIVPWLVVFGGGAAFAADAHPNWPSAAFEAGDFGGGRSVTRAQWERFLPPSKAHPFEDGEHHVARQLDGEKEAVSLPANIQWISKAWNGDPSTLPYLVYMPEKDQVLMLVGLCGVKRFSAVIASNDRGKTWGTRRWLSVDAAGQPNASAMGLTYLGHGELLCYSTDMSVRWFSADYGQTWRKSEVKAPRAEGRSFWDPLLATRDADGRVQRLAQGWWKPSGVAWGSPGSGYDSATPYSQAYFRSSTDRGQTWSDDIKVPQWRGVNEVDIVVAANGDWVAACRTDHLERFVRTAMDDYGGLGVSISRDQGKTWSDLKILYPWGRHHPSMVLLPDGRLLMSYIARMGYPANAAGFPQYAVEAAVSDDNGQTWDLDHRYILATWAGAVDITHGSFYLGAPQSSSTIVLPDGTILTAFATGFRNGAKDTGATWKSDIMLVTWRVNPQASEKQ